MTTDTDPFTHTTEDGFEVTLAFLHLAHHAANWTVPPSSLVYNVMQDAQLQVRINGETAEEDAEFDLSDVHTHDLGVRFIQVLGVLAQCIDKKGKTIIDITRIALSLMFAAAVPPAYEVVEHYWDQLAANGDVPKERKEVN